MTALILISFCSVLPVKEGALERVRFVFFGFGLIWFLLFGFFDSNMSFSSSLEEKKLLSQYMRSMNNQS